MARPADRIAKLMAQWEPAIRDAVLGAVKSWRDSISLRELTALIKAGDVEGAIRAVGLDRARFRSLSRIIEQAFEAGGEDATAGIRVVRGPLGLRINPLFDVRAPRAQAWLTQHTTDLITQITEDQRALIRQTLAPLRNPLADPMLTGDTPQKLALDLVGRVSRVSGRREGGYLGLTSQQAEWAANYERQLRELNPEALTRKLRDRRFDKTIQKAIREGKPLPADKIEAMVSTYKNKALLYRANVIAENEASTALHTSQAEAWEQAIRRGVVAESQVRRFWLTSADERVRHSHRLIPGMNKEGVGLHQPFQTPKGPTMQPGWSFDPGCRCRVRVRVVEDPAPANAPVSAPRVLVNA